MMADTQTAHQREIGTIEVIVIAGDRWSIAVDHIPRRGSEAIPNGFTAPVEGGRAFDLRSGGGYAPDKIGWK